jgi:hypothetical protein
MRSVSVAIHCAISMVLLLFLCGGCVRVEQAPRSPVDNPSSLNPWEQAKDAIEAGNSKDATKFAEQMLKENTDPKSWQYGNIIHEANQILGLAALQEGRVEDAKRYLIEAGKTPGSPQLDSFGPNMVLAQQLLDRGENDSVIQYLDLVSRFWGHTSEEELKKMEKKKPGISESIKRGDKENLAQIAQWKADIKAGKKPTLNNSGGLE